MESSAHSLYGRVTDIIIDGIINDMSNIGYAMVTANAPISDIPDDPLDTMVIVSRKV